MRVIKEFFKPLLKCERIGHKLTILHGRVRRESHEWREVVADFNVDFSVCRRCGYKSKPKNERKVDSFTGCSMPRHMWESIEKDGYVEID